MALKGQFYPWGYDIHALKSKRIKGQEGMDSRMVGSERESGWLD